MDQGIRFVITGDTSGLDNASKKAESALDALGRKITQLQNEIGQNIKISQGYEKAISDLSNELKSGTISQEQFAKSLSRLQRDEKETTIETNNLRKQLSLLQRDQKSLASSTGGAGQTFTSLNKDVRGTIPTMTSFSQIIQDAPYGIRGVANNIQQLTSQFGHLSANAGGSGKALKAMLSSLAGPAGILLAVSAVTSLLVSYGDEIGNIIRGNNALAASQKEVNKALNDFYGEQVTKINAYVSILEDVNTKEADRKRITDELIETVPSLTEADFKYGNNLDIVKEKIGQYVLAQASRIEADTLVAENAEKLGQKARITQIKSIQDETKRIEEFRKFLRDEGENLTITKFDPLGGTQKTFVLPKEEIIKRFNDFANDLEQDLSPVQERINELYGITFGGGLADADADAKANSKVKSQFEKVKEALSLLKKELEDSILTKGLDADATKNLALGYKILLDEINRVNKATADPSKGEKERLAKAEKNRAKLIEIETDLQDEIFRKAEERLEQSKAIYEGLGVEIEKALKPDLDVINIGKGFAEILELEKLENRIDSIKTKFGSLTENIDFSNLDNRDLNNLESKLSNAESGIRRIKNLMDDWGLDPGQFNLEGLNLEQLDLLNQKLKTSLATVNIFANAISSSFGAMASQISQSLQTGNAIVDAFISSIISGLAQMLSQMLTQAITQAIVGNVIASAAGVAALSQGVQIATSFAASLGPAGFVALPALLAATELQISAALAVAKIPKGFAQGGIVGGGKFTGDNIPIFVNSGERILTVQDQSFLTNILRGGTAGTTNRQQPDMIVGEVILRGTTQVIQMRRAQKKMDRFY